MWDADKENTQACKKLWEEEVGFILLLSAGRWLIHTISFEVEWRLSAPESGRKNRIESNLWEMKASHRVTLRLPSSGKTS